MIQRLGLALTRVFRRFVPDPFVIAIVLTLVTAGAALVMGNFGASAGLPLGERCTRLVDSWRGTTGLWSFLAFSMQMCLVLVTGHALATTRPVRRLIEVFAGLPRTTAQGAALVAGCACVSAVVNWGFGLIVGAILAREVARSLARRSVPCHYPLLAAAGYTGLLVWHGGLSGSAPLSMTTIENARKVLPAATIERLTAAGFGEGVGLSQTLFSPMNLVITGGLLVLTPVVMALLAPAKAEEIAPPAEVLAPRTAEPEAPGERTVSEWLDGSPVVSLCLAAGLVWAFARFTQESSLRMLGLNEVNVAMLALGLVLHGSPRSYLAAAQEGARGCLGIILQFPLYAGIMAMMVVSGLARQAATGLLELGGDRGLPVLTFLGACFINLLVPSGGGQWGVQGPIALESGLDAGIDPGVMVMAVAYGDQTTNMLQPFWALPLLAITGVRARDIVGYTCIVMLVAIMWISGVMLVMG